MNDKQLAKEIRNIKENFDTIYAKQSAARERFLARHPDAVKKAKLSMASRDAKQG